MSDDQVAQFLSFTGGADPEQAASYLEMSGGDLDTAVSLYMEHNSGAVAGTGAGGGFGDAAMPAPTHEVRAPDATRTMRLMDDPNDMMMGGHPAQHPAYQLMNAMMDEQLAQSAFASAPTAASARNAREQINAAAEGKQNDDDDEGYDYGSDADDNGMDEDEDDDDEVEIVGGSAPPAPARLSDMFAPPDHLIHKAGGFQGARTSAKESKRWLLVNLQRDSEFSCHALNRDVWRDELVENLVREGFIFWQTMDMTAEGRTYSERYQVQDYPHLAIIDPRTGRLLWRKEGWTQEKPLTAEAFAEIAMDFCSRNSFDRPPTARLPNSNGSSASSRPIKRPMNQMSEDEQVQAAMRASLGDNNTNKDNEKDQKMAGGDDDDEVEVVENPDTKPAATEAVEDKKVESTFIQDLLAIDVGDEPAKGARMQLRMPDGKRMVRKFAPAATVRTIYAFLAQSTEEANSDRREFTLMVGFPHRDLVTDMDNTIESCKLAGEAISMHWK